MMRAPKLLEIPNIRYGHRFIISRKAYENWEGRMRLPREAGKIDPGAPEE